VQKMVIEIGMEQTRLFHCRLTGSAMPIFVIEIVNGFSERALR